MPTVLPPPAVIPWPKLRRAIWLRILVAGLNVRMKWLPATNRQAVAAACRWIAYCEEMHRLLGLPEPAHVAELREVFLRPLPDGSTLSASQEIGHAQARPSEAPITLQEIEEARDYVAYAVEKYGDAYLPVLRRLEREVEAARQKESPGDRARRAQREARVRIEPRGMTREDAAVAEWRASRRH